MSTDFTYGEKQIVSSGPFKPSGKDMPLDARTRINTYSEKETIPNPFVGMIVTVLTDEKNNNKMTDYKVKSLKANSAGIANMVIDEMIPYVDYLGVSGGSSGGGSGEGLTSEQARQLQTAYGHSQTTHVQVSDIPTKTSELINDSDFVTSTEMADAINNASIGGGSGQSVDLSIYTKNIDFNKATTELRTSRFNGIKVLVDGDSITEANFRCERNWHDFLSDWLGFGTVINKAVSGTGFISSTNGVLSRITGYPADVDLILLMGCMNDLHYVREDKLGKFEDNSDVETVYGGLHKMFQTLLEKFPKTPIMVITSQPRAEVEDNPTYNGEKRWGKSTPAYQINEALKEVCNHYAIPCLDLYSSSFIKPWITSNRNRLCPDGVHPNTEGQYVMAEQILPFVRQAWIPTDDFLNANVPLTGISLNHSNLTLGVGGQFTLSVIPSPTNASNANVRWSSNNPSVATVEEAVVRAVTVGDAVITATSIEGEYTATCTVTVSEEGGATIITDGLVTYLEALDNTKSSNTWIARYGDLNGTMSNFNTTTSKYNETTKSIDLANQGSCTISGSGQTGSFTAECLMTLDSFNCSATRIPFSNYSSSEIADGIAYINRATTVEISDRTSGTNVIASTPKDGSISTNYVLVTITVDSDKTTNLYLNGELKGSGTCKGFSANDFILNHTLLSSADKISIASFRLYSKSLSQTEIQNNLTCEQLLRTF